MRMLLCELNRIHSHLIWLGTGALELGAISMLWYCFRDREAVLDLFELVAGFRMHTRYFQAGGLAEDVPVGFWDECRKFTEEMPMRIDDYESILDKQAIFLERMKGIGPFRPRTRSRSASPGRCCAAPGSTGTTASASRTSRTTRSTGTSRSS